MLFEIEFNFTGITIEIFIQTLANSTRLPNKVILPFYNNGNNVEVIVKIELNE